MSPQKLAPCGRGHRIAVTSQVV